MGDFDELEGRLVHRPFEFLVALPVAVGLLDDDIALEQQALQHLLDIEGRILGVAHAERDILEVTEQGHVMGVGFCVHGSSFFPDVTPGP